MTRSIEELATSCFRESYGMHNTTDTWFDYERFADLVRQECQNELQQEWYRLNNIDPAPRESSRDTGFRVGAKAGLITGIELLRKMWEPQCEW